MELFITQIFQLLSESDPEVRDSSSAALGSMMKSVHEKNMATLVGDVAADKNKWSKVYECLNMKKSYKFLDNRVSREGRKGLRGMARITTKTRCPGNQ